MKRHRGLKPGAPLKRRTPLRAASLKRRREQRERTLVVQRVLARDRGCVLREHGPCNGPLDVDEVVSRGRGGSFLDDDNCQTLCRLHHRFKHERVHWASVLGLWGYDVMQRHTLLELGDNYSLTDLEALRAHALKVMADWGNP